MTNIEYKSKYNVIRVLSKIEIEIDRTNTILIRGAQEIDIYGTNIIFD